VSPGKLRVVVLGAGFGGLEVATRLSAALGDEVDVRLVDRGDGFVFGFSKLDVMFGRTDMAHVVLPYSDCVHPGVHLVRANVLGIDPMNRSVTLDSGTLGGDILVVALGADLAPEATPGLVEGGHEFYSVAGALAAREALHRFDGGRVVIAVTSTPFKCPPAPSETALLLHEFLSVRGLRDRSEIALVMPLPTPIPPSPQASEAILAAFAARGIAWHPGQLVRAVDPRRQVAVLADDAELGYDLLLAVPKHQAPAVVVDSGLTEEGWIPVEPQTLLTRFPGVYAVGDVTSVGTPKAGVFAEGQAKVVAEQIVSGAKGLPAHFAYDGRGICFLEFGDQRVAKVDVTFTPGRSPHRSLEGPSLELAGDKAAFGAERAVRWFGRDWTPLGPTEAT
jgi:sulfide:quinone oxidoreductase